MASKKPRVDPALTNSPQAVPTSNRFDLFNSPMFAKYADSSLPGPSQSKPTTIPEKPSRVNPSTKPTRPPPLYIKIASTELVSFSNNLQSIVGDRFNLKFLGNQVRVQFQDIEPFIVAKQAFLKANLKFHTYSLPSEKPLTTVLKGLPLLDTDIILNELRGKDLQPISCSVLKNKNTFTIYKITFTPGTSLSQVRKTGFLYYCRVYWEKYNSSLPYSQCYRCQAFGHSSANCNKTPKCVKCGSEHPTKECSKTPEIPPTCANCQGSHTANYSKCPRLLSYLSKKATLRAETPPTNNKITPLVSPTPPPPLWQSNQGKSYSDALKSSPSISRASPSSTPSPQLPELQEFTSLWNHISQLFDFNKAITILRQLRDTLTNTPNTLAKFEAVAEAAQALFGK